MTEKRTRKEAGEGTSTAPYATTRGGGEGAEEDGRISLVLKRAGEDTASWGRVGGAAYIYM